MYVIYHRIGLDFKNGLRNRGSFVHSQSIQKENKRRLGTQIMCDVDNFKPGDILFRIESHVFASEEYECK